MPVNALLIFARNPELGKVKTRLASEIGDQEALEVYRKLLAHTHQACQDLGCSKYVYYSEKILLGDLWEETNFEKEIQKGAELGERMESAFQACFAKEHPKVIIIGTDCPQISKRLIQDAFEALDKNDLVIGPAKDGGYYLLGMKQLYKEVFEDKKWSTSSVLAETLSDIEKLNLSIAVLEPLADVDYKADLYLLENLSTFENLL